MKNYRHFLEYLVNVSDDISLHRNPQNIKIYKPWIRGFILRNGDFYLMDSTDGFIIHDTGLKIAYSQGILKDSPHNWEEEAPWEFLCVQRLSDTAEFYVSESYDSNNNFNYDMSKSLIDAAQNKSYEYNPTLLFYNSKIFYNEK